MPRVMLVDDHEVTRVGLRALLAAEDDLDVVAEADDAEKAVAEARKHRPDVAVVDVRLPGRSGVEACRDIRSECPGTAVLILTSYDDDQALLDAIMAGAAGYILKRIQGHDLVDAIRSVAAGRRLLDPGITTRVMERLNSPKRNLNQDIKTLSPIEFRILGLIADGLTNRQIGDRLHLAEKTVKNYVSSIFSKLRVSRRAGAAACLAEWRALNAQPVS